LLDYFYLTYIWWQTTSAPVNLSCQRLKIRRITIYLKPRWDADIFFWPRKSPTGIPQSCSMWVSLK
jgi:hypothetical protein